MQEDVYKTITEATEEVLFKDKNSKFFGYAFPVSSEDEIKELLEEIKKKHYNARHWCYAWQLGTESIQYRANDDGEPNNSAGMPIYGQIQSFEVTNLLIIVVRYFGGVKLGVPGLINAYRTAAQMAMEVANIEERTIDFQYKISFEYKDMNNVMRVIKEKNLTVISQTLEMSCEILIAVRKTEAEACEQAFVPFYEVTLKRIL
ncbi:uncharacterized protein, YigZ family [Pustulibacterium marinum]|uniref:Uncharacterized protein, YigZ family n=1 Tax=Pustulibacterium marinum TaxID=1224947 RepID=A0A1I7IK10_9FLAO|nr:YigZ family protein [Pustulibacterium marinum]SFU73277.1 uncharacterized protein, YigZ family [Pustulibacterium marinum]